jgi:O-antigen/teichoic acid export membrane protein
MSTKRKFAGDTLISGIAQVAVKLLGIASLAILTKSLTKEYVGVWVQIGVTASLMLPFVTMGFQTAAVRYIAGKEDKRQISALFHLMLGTVIVNCFAFTGVIFILQNGFSSVIFADEAYSSFVVLAGIWLFLEAVHTMMLSFLRAENKIALASSYTIARSVISIAAFYLVLVVFHGDLTAAVLSILVTGAGLAVFMYLYEVAGKVGITFAIDDRRSVFKDILKFSLPFIPTGIMAWVLAVSDRIFIVNILGLADTAVYSVAYQLGQVLMLFYLPLGFVAYPVLVDFWEHDQKDRVRVLLEKASKMLVYLIFPSIVGLYTLGPTLIPYITTDAYVVAPSLILWISLGIFLSGIYNINVYILHLVKKTYINTFIFIAAAGVNIALNYLLIFAIGIEGAAISTFVSYLILAGVVSYVARKEVFYTFDLAFTAKCVVASLAMYLVISRIPVTSLPMLVGVCLLGIAIYVPLTFLFRCLSPEEVRDIRNLATFQRRKKEKIVP